MPSRVKLDQQAKSSGFYFSIVSSALVVIAFWHALAETVATGIRFAALPVSLRFDRVGCSGESGPVGLPGGTIRGVEVRGVRHRGGHVPRRRVVPRLASAPGARDDLVAAFGFDVPPFGKTLGLALFATAVVVPIAWGLGQLSALAMESFKWEPVAQQTVLTLQSTVSWTQKLCFGLVAVLVAPCAEELLFRGILYPMIKQLGRPMVALWSTSLLFAVIHSNTMTFIPLTFLAVVLVLLYEKTGNLLAPIVTHSTFNLVNFLWLVIGQQSPNLLPVPS